MAAQGKIGRRSPLAKATGDESTRIGTDQQKQILRQKAFLKGWKEPGDSSKCGFREMKR